MIFSMLKFVGVFVLILVAIPFGLILSQSPKPLPAREGLDFTEAMGQDLAQLPDTKAVTMRDGAALAVRTYGTQDASKPLVVMVHGSGWNGIQFDWLARAVSAEAMVLVPDLRGHGAAPVRRGDVDYIGQMEDDLADLITAYALPEQKVMMLGHSSGGGLVVRFAGGAHGAMMDRAVLLAPFLQYNAAATRASSGGWATVLLRRVIGLSMLNGAGITGLNHLTVIQFSMPDAVLDGPLGHTATTAYSYRLNTSFAPRRDYLTDVAALPDFSLIAGAGDEAFYAEKYEPEMSPVTGKGRYLVIPGLSHLGVVYAPETLAAIQEDLRGL